MVSTRWVRQVAAAVLAIMPSACNDVSAPATDGMPAAAQQNILALTGAEARGAPQPLFYLTGTAGASADNAPRIRIVDHMGRAVPNARVRFSVIGGGGTLSYADSLTDALGEARADWVLGTSTLLLNQLQVTGGSPGGVLLFAAWARAGVPARIIRAVHLDSVAFLNEKMSPAVVVADRFGNGVPDVAVQFAVQAGAGWIAGPPDQRWLTSRSGLATLAEWYPGLAGRNVVAASVPGLEPVSFEVHGINHSGARNYISAPATVENFGTVQFKLTLDHNGRFIEDVWSLDTNARVSRFTGRYQVDGNRFTLTGCSILRDPLSSQDGAYFCSIKTGQVQSDVIAIGSVSYTRSLGVPPAFPDVTSPARVFEGVDSAHYAMHGSQLASRYVLYDNRAFALQYASANRPFFEYRGTYTELNDSITFHWEGWSVAGPWAATAKLSGDTLDVKYNVIMQLSDFEDGLYIRKSK